ncbi:MAG: hypothetical protein ER33_10545 [Cyanobium sp. CACIAM 14]|nr:MAG: hypothetical protein ER33_10545 [Cyanobium sp. CACIAM 14]
MGTGRDSRAHPLGAGAALAVTILGGGYAMVLAIGLLTLPAPAEPIQDPWFTLLEGLILAIAPAMVVFMAALHAWAPAQGRGFTLVALVFMSLCAGLTCAVHFSVLALSRQAAFAAPPWSTLVFAFRWPSLVYALDILAWDLFFPIAALFAARALREAAGAQPVRTLLDLSALMAFGGLAGVPLASMPLRNIGIVGYAVLFPLAAALMTGRLRGDRAGGEG